MFCEKYMIVVEKYTRKKLRFREVDCDWWVVAEQLLLRCRAAGLEEASPLYRHKFDVLHYWCYYCIILCRKMIITGTYYFKHQDRMVSLLWLVTLRIWKRAEPMTTNRKMPSIMGPTCDFSSLFCVIYIITVRLFFTLPRLSMLEAWISLFIFIVWSLGYIMLLLPLREISAS
jgi:hypothetical protein